MMRIMKILYALSLGVSIVISISCFGVWWESMNKPYNAKGRYWDGSVIWQEQAITSYGLLALGALLCTVLIGFYWRKVMKL